MLPATRPLTLAVGSLNRPVLGLELVEGGGRQVMATTDGLHRRIWSHHQGAIRTLLDDYVVATTT
jgi:hypothetical protein